MNTSNQSLDLAPRIDSGESGIPRLQEWLFILVLGWILFGVGVGNRGLWSAHEGRAAQNAQNMFDQGTWFVPTLFTDEPDYQKPPLYYWLVAVVSALQGGEVSAWSVRLPSTLAAIAGLFLVHSMGRRLFSPQAALWAVLILATTTRYAWLARVGRIDMPLTLSITFCLYVFWKHLYPRTTGLPTQPLAAADRTIPTAFYWSLLAGVYLKGPVAVVLVFLPIVTYLAWTRTPFVPGFQTGWYQTWRELRLLPGMLMVGTCAAVWYGYVTWLTNGRYFWEFFVYHNVERALGTSEALKSGPVWFYLPRILADAFPWSILFPALLIWIVRSMDRSRTAGNAESDRGDGSVEATQTTEPRLREPHRFLLAWIASQFLFLSFVSFKRPDYLLPVFPALALLLGGWLEDRSRRFIVRRQTRPARHPRRHARIVRVTAALIAVILVPLLIWGTIEFLKKGIVSSLGKWSLAREHLNGTDFFMLGHLETLLQAHWPLLGIVVIIVTGCVWMFHIGWYNRDNTRVALGLGIPWAACFLFQVHVILPSLDPLREMSRFAEVIRQVASGEPTIYYFGKFDPDLVFHAGRPARLVGDWEELVRIGTQPERCFVVMKAEQLEWVARDPRMTHWVKLADNSETAFGAHREPRILLTNHPPRIVRVLEDDDHRLLR